MAGQIHKLIAFKIFIFVCDFFDFFPVGKNDLIRLRFHIFGTVQNNAMQAQIQPFFGTSASATIAAQSIMYPAMVISQ